MLQTTKNRRPLTRRGWYAATLVALGLSLPLAAAGLAPAVAVIPLPERPPTPAVSIAPQDATPAPAPTPARARALVAPRQVASIAGQFVDQTGGTLPGVTVTLTDRQTGQQIMATTDPAGRFVFRDLAPSEYTLVGSIPGFASAGASITLVPGAALTPRFTMGLGSLSESITVLCSVEGFSILRALFPVLEARQTSTTPIRVGGSVRVPKKIRDVRPTCPAGIVTSEVSVALKGRIGVDGAMTDVALDDSQPGIAAARDLVEAALYAVRQWEFTPTELNREPVEVGIRVHITFRPQ